MYDGKMQETFAGPSGAGPSGASAQEGNIDNETVEYCDTCDRSSSTMLIYCEGGCEQKKHASCWTGPRIVKKDFIRDYEKPQKFWACDACQGITRKRGRTPAEKKTNDDKKDESKDDKGKKRKEDQS